MSSRARCAGEVVAGGRHRRVAGASPVACARPRIRSRAGFRDRGLALAAFSPRRRQLKDLDFPHPTLRQEHHPMLEINSLRAIMIMIAATEEIKLQSQSLLPPYAIKSQLDRGTPELQRRQVQLPWPEAIEIERKTLWRCAASPGSSLVTVTRQRRPADLPDVHPIPQTPAAATDATPDAGVERSNSPNRQHLIVWRNLSPAHLAAYARHLLVSPGHHPTLTAISSIGYSLKL